MEHYAEEAHKRRIKFNEKLAMKDIKEGSLVLRYNNRFDYNKSDKFSPHWEGPFKVLERFANGSYHLMDISGKQHQTRVNGWRLKPYFSQVFNEKGEDFDKVKKATLSCRLCHGSSHMCYPKKQDPEEVSLDSATSPWD